MLSTAFVWILGYILMGLGLLLMIDEPGMKWYNRLVFVVWPIPVAAFFVFAIGAMIVGSYNEIKDYIKYRKL